MALTHWQRTIVDAQGNVLPGATVEVRSEATGNLAPLKANRAGTVGKGNPFAADGDGFAEFYLRGGAYRIIATKGALTQTWRYVAIGTAQEIDVEDLYSYSGLRYVRSLATGDDAPPGALRGNNANLAGATTLYLAAEDANGNDQGDRLSRLGDSTSDIRGYLVLRQLSGGGELVFRITGTVDDLRPSLAVIAVPVALEAGLDVFAEADSMVVDFSRTGDKGDRSTIAVGTVSTVDPGDPATVTNVGTDIDAIFNFEIPQGDAATIAVGTVSTVDPGDPATVTNVGTSGAAVFDFEIPAGPAVADGDKGDVVVSAGGTIWTTENSLRYDIDQPGLSDTQKRQVQINAGVSALFGWRNLICANNAGTPNTKFDITADAGLLRDALGDTYLHLSPGTLTCDVTVAGPAANGRDQAGAFSAGSWIHFYGIEKPDGTIASIASASAAAPTLPIGYTRYAYAGAVRFNGSSQLVKTRIRGIQASYDAAQSVGTALTATVETALNIATLVPPNALNFILEAAGLFAVQAANVIQVYNTIGVVSGSDYLPRWPHIQITATGLSSFQGGMGSVAVIPNVGQQFYYRLTIPNGSSPQIDFNILGYTLPNGAA